MQRAREWWSGAPTQRSASSGVQGTIAPARRDPLTVVTPEAALTLSTVFRGISIHATAASQLSIDEYRWGSKLDRPSSIIETPNSDLTRSRFIERSVVSLYTDGNAFYRLVRSPLTAEVVDIEILPPREVHIRRRKSDNALEYVKGRDVYRAADIRHLKFLDIPGRDRGLGPVEAGRMELAGALDARNYGSQWLTTSNVPDGVLSTDQPLKPGDGDAYRNVWYGRNADGTPKVDANGDPLPVDIGERLRVLGQGLHYEPILLKPADVQFLETQQFGTTQIARLLGLPASLLLAAVEGNSQTYANVEQDWIAYVRFGLMKTLLEIENALSSILPHGRTAKFNIDALLRTDTKTRYEAHALGYGKWLTADDIRSIEKLPALTDDQRAALATAQQPQEAPVANN